MEARVRPPLFGKGGRRAVGRRGSVVPTGTAEPERPSGANARSGKRSAPGLSAARNPQGRERCPVLRSDVRTMQWRLFRPVTATEASTGRFLRRTETCGSGRRKARNGNSTLRPLFGADRRSMTAVLPRGSTAVAVQAGCVAGCAGRCSSTKCREGIPFLSSDLGFAPRGALAANGGRKRMAEASGVGASPERPGRYGGLRREIR